jgi:uncharacterized protein Usg
MDVELQRSSTLHEEQRTFTTTYHENGDIQTVDEIKSHTLQVSETIRFRMKLRDSVDTFVHRKALDVQQQMSDPDLLQEDLNLRPCVSGGLYDHLDVPLTEALRRHLAELTRVREDVLQHYPLGSDPDDLPRTLYARTLWMKSNYPPLFKLFDTFEEITVSANQYFEETHMPEKIDSLLGNFPDHIKMLVHENKSLLKYARDFQKKTDEMADVWVHSGGNPADPMYKTYLEAGLADWPAPAEIEAARDRFLGPCVCTRSVDDLRLFKHSFGFTPKQVMEFYPDHVDHKYSSMWQMYLDFERGDFPVITDFIASVHTILRTAMCLKKTGVPPPEFQDATILEVTAYHVGAPADYQSLPHNWNNGCGGDWLTVTYVAYAEKGGKTLTLPGCYVHALFPEVPSYIHLLEEFVNKEMDPTQEIPMTPVCVKSDGSMRFMPARLVDHAKEFAWIKDSQEFMALVVQSIKVMPEEEQDLDIAPVVGQSVG